MHAWRDHVARTLVVGALLGGAVGCAHSAGSYVWVDDLPAPQNAPAYTIGVGDLLNVQVWDHDKMSSRTRVRDDGYISMPLLDDAIAAGRTPEQLARELEASLKDKNLVVNPRVTVVLEETGPLKIPVMGEVARKGVFTLENGAGLAEAIASAGGLTEFAHRDQIFVLRRTPPKSVLIRFTFDEISSATGNASSFRLRAGDVVIAK